MKRTSRDLASNGFGIRWGRPEKGNRYCEAPLAWGEIVEVVGTDGFAVEVCYADSQAEEHALDLVVEAFVDGEAAARFC